MQILSLIVWWNRSTGRFQGVRAHEHNTVFASLDTTGSVTIVVALVTHLVSIAAKFHFSSASSTSTCLLNSIHRYRNCSNLYWRIYHLFSFSRILLATIYKRKNKSILKKKLPESRGIVIASRSKVWGFKPRWGRWIFSGRKNPEHKSFGREPWVPSLRFQARQRTLSLKNRPLSKI